MKIYLLGPARRWTDSEGIIKMFAIAQRELEDQGHIVINPMLQVAANSTDEKEALTWRMKLLLQCESACVLPYWQEDKLSQVEMAAVIQTNMPYTKAEATVMPPRIFFYLQ